MQPFDAIKTPLTGTTLIEASAGTGKTYTIAGLFVRLVLEQELEVEQILVVTYTTAATEELKTRIRGKLIQTRQALLRGDSCDPFIHRLISTLQDPGTAAVRLDGVLADFDRAAILTIHGFCQRLLHEHAFETGTFYDTELMADPTVYYQEVAEDFWRKNLYDAAPELIGFLLAEKKVGGPEIFHRLMKNVTIPDLEILPKPTEPRLAHLDEYRCLSHQLAADWKSVRRQIGELLTDQALNATIYGSLNPDRRLAGRRARDVKIAALVESMDRFTGEEVTGFPLFNGFEKFSAARLKRATKKNCVPPEHPFFDLCDRLFGVSEALKTEMERYFLYLKSVFFQFARLALADAKKRYNRQFYEDLLLTVRNALQKDRPGSDVLVKAVRRRFKAALVDEFQDTDSVQYAIFSRLFGQPPAILFMIGDPKQSIYGFRGADIFSYMEAAERATEKYTLHENWRSEPGMITAVNTLFAGVRRPFFYDDIRFEKGRVGGGFGGASTTEEPALILWYLPPREGKPMSKGDATRRIAAAVGDEIARLVAATAAPLPLADIAVLVRTNRQARLIKESLSERRIPSVLYGAGNIFDSPEAGEILQVLRGVLENGREERFRAALVTDMLGVSAAEIDLAAVSEDRLEDRRARFREYAEEWNQFGFMRMMRWLMAREGVRTRLLAHPDGDRRLTNLLHLAEILHQQTVQEEPGMTGLLKWLVDKLDPATPRSEEHQLRLESDARAVRIVTTHRSKGLEYPVVFCPFAWEGSLITRDRDIICHEQGPPRRRVLDLGSGQVEDRRRLAQEELLAENLRLLYVALTRAKTRCYLVWGHINTAETSAPAYLLHRPECDGDDIVAALATHLTGLTDGDRRADLARLAAASGGSILLRDIPADRRIPPSAPINDATPLFCRNFSGVIDTTWRISSYSALVSRRNADADSPDRDALPPPVADSTVADIALPATELRTIFTFPRGARAGIFFHELLEQLDFTDAVPENREARIHEKLRAHGFDPSWTAAVKSAIDRVLSVSLVPGAPGLTLGSIGLRQRLNEMAFYFPVKPVTPRRLRDIFAAHPAAGIPPAFPSDLGRLRFAPSRGFLKGYIDMAFVHEGRYYLIDWKSNHLGHRIEDYRAENLQAAMNEAYYILQYCLYTLALNRYLKMRDPAYGYETHFGGVFYIFIRGIDPEKGPAYGIYRDRPEAGLIDALDQALIAAG